MDAKRKFIILRASNSMNDDRYDTAKAWERVKNKSMNKTGHTRHLRWISYAACIVLLVGITIYITKDTPAPEETNLSSIASQITMAPQSQVMLTLANGERIQLARQQEVIEVEELGMSLTRDSSNGLFQYQNHIDTIKEEIEPQYNELYVPKGADFYLKLPDGSVVNINSESTLRFPVRFSPASREVYLEGEAYFQIAKDPKAPFTVHAGGKDITVLGTKFNVSAYQDDTTWITTLVEGKVMVNDREQSSVLHPSEQLVINTATGVATTRIVDTELYTSWIDGKFYFKGYRFEDIVKKLERWYDFKMIYEDEAIKDMTFRGTIDKHQPLEQLLRYLEETTNIKFNIQDKEIKVSKTH